MKLDKPINILTADLVIPDLIVNISDNPKLQDLVDKYQLKRGGKRALSYDEFKEFSAVVDKMKKDGKVIVEPGGSSANVLVTLSKLLGKGKLNVKYFGVVGDDEYTDIVKRSLKEAGIELVPDPETYKNQKPETARSFILMYPDGARTIATYPGNARDILKADMVTEDMVKKSDVIFILGSAWERFDHGFVNKITDMRFKNQKELWLALPTHAEFGKENGELFRYIIPSANVILGNKGELERIYENELEKINNGSDKKVDAIHALRDLLEKRKYLFDSEGWKSYRQPVALITDDIEPAYIITGVGDPNEDDSTRGITKIDTKKVESRNVVSTLGAGDTSFAGFLAGLAKNRTNEESAELAMTLAGEKVRNFGPRLKHPRASLHTAANFNRIPKELANSILNPEREMTSVGR